MFSPEAAEYACDREVSTSPDLSHSASIALPEAAEAAINTAKVIFRQ